MRWGSHTVLAYSRPLRTMEMLASHLRSSGHPLMLRLMNPSFSFARVSSLHMWGPHDKLCDRITARYRSCLVDFRMTPHKTLKCVRWFLPLRKDMMEHLLGLKTMPQSAAQCSKFRRSCCRLIWSSSEWMGRQTKQWSANSQQRVSWWTWDGRSLIYRIKSRGPRTVPWGTRLAVACRVHQKMVKSCRRDRYSG